ncbi:beta-galactosidase [Bacteroidia bacterium]|nr:beta-galactosidase [Bacteroidia bacterium]
MKNHFLKFLLFGVLFIYSANSWSNPNDTGKLIYPQPFAPGEGYINRYEKEYRQELCLNGLWDFQGMSLPADYKQGKGIAPELPQPVYNAWDQTKIKIPSPWNINSFANRNVAGPDHRNYPSYPEAWEQVKMAWLKKNVKVPAEWKNKIIQLHFEAVAGFAEVYVNDKKVGENFDIFLPFDVDITEMAVPGQSIEVRVGVRSQSLFEDRSTIGQRIIPAGSMWGSHISGIWQDVYLVALPKIQIEGLYIKPLLSKKVLELTVTVKNRSDKKESLTLQGSVSPWINQAGNEMNSAPVPKWILGSKALDVPENNLTVAAGQTSEYTITVPVEDGKLAYWTPNNPHLYALILNLKNKQQTFDAKYERFGWREWTIRGTKQYLNGEAIELRGDSWHFMGVPQLTRRYAWAWFTAIKDANGNAVRPHAQIYPRFYLDMADEMGICVLNETANWASDGGSKMDSPRFWETSKEHLRRFVLRDRNHASVFGWSISNENKPVINHVFNRPDLMVPQIQAWKDWIEIVSSNDPTRPWISSDGEEDGEGILPVTVGHYGDFETMKHWLKIGKPWGVGEHSMAYYGTPQQVSKYNGERAYESQLGRMEGLANECYHLLANQRQLGASYVSVFNLAWYALKPLPLGKRNLSTPPSLTEDGIFFTGYEEGVPGIQPERIGPYSSTFNPGYDPNLPLYETWPMFDALRAANAPGGPAWSQWAEIAPVENEKAVTPGKNYEQVVFIGKDNAKLKDIFDRQGVVWTEKTSPNRTTLYIIDGSEILNADNEKRLKQSLGKNADVWIWGITPQSQTSYTDILPLPLQLEANPRSSFLPESKSWMRGLKNSDFYFCELQKTDAAQYGLSGPLVEEGEILLNACVTDWRRWNQQAEEIKTAGILRSENEQTAATPVFVRYPTPGSVFYISALQEFANSEKGFNTLSRILENAGILCKKTKGMSSAELFFLRDNRLQFPASTPGAFVKNKDGMIQVECWVFSPRALDDLLVEPDMPKLNLLIEAQKSTLSVNGQGVDKFNKTRKECEYKELPLQQGWNHLVLSIGEDDRHAFWGVFKCDNKPDFMPLLKAAFVNPEMN